MKRSAEIITTAYKKKYRHMQQENNMMNDLSLRKLERQFSEDSSRSLNISSTVAILLSYIDIKHQNASTFLNNSESSED